MITLTGKDLNAPLKLLKIASPAKLSNACCHTFPRTTMFAGAQSWKSDRHQNSGLVASCDIQGVQQRSARHQPQPTVSLNQAGQEKHDLAHADADDFR